MRKVGLFGGAFDPPHNGHLQVAGAVLDALSLDEIRFIPTNVSPHKHNSRVKPEHRFLMLELAVEGNEHFTADRVEIDREGRSYTIDTVQFLKEREPETEFYFIVGGDMIDDLSNWVRIDELSKMVQFVGVNRPAANGKSRISVILVDMVLSDISSSDIRQRVGNGLSVRKYLPEKVETFIKEHRLYESR